MLPEYYKKENVSEVCERCGNDTAGMLIHFPFSKKYISLCGVCYYGLGILMKKHGDDFMNGPNELQQRMLAAQEKVVSIVDSAFQCDDCKNNK